VIANISFQLSHTYLQEHKVILTRSSQVVSQYQANGDNMLHHTQEERSISGSDNEEESRPKKEEEEEEEQR
jgi:hypothetical protein